MTATVDALNICGENLVNSPGVWYSYQQSSDTIIHVSTCTNQTNFDTALTVYTGDCSSLQCVDGRDDDLECDAGSDEHSTVSWQAAAGQQYYVLVHGSEANHTGDFGLVVTASEPLTVTSSSIESLESLLDAFLVFCDSRWNALSIASRVWSRFFNENRNCKSNMAFERT